MALRRMPVGHLIGVYAVGLFWCFVASFKLLIKLVSIGPKQLFKVQKRDTRPKVLDDENLWTHGYVNSQNVKLHYVTCGPEDKPLMLFVHGFPEFWYSWRHQLKEFSKDYRCVAIDMRGYNESDKPAGVHNYSMDKLSQDLKEVIHALGFKKCILVAHDWGGAVAWDFAWREPEMVEKLIACNIGNSKAFQQHIKKSTSQFLKSWYMFVFQLPFFPEFYCRLNDYEFIEDAFTGEMGPKRPGAFTLEDIYCFKMAIAKELSGPINFYRAALRYKPKQLPSDKIKVPTLIVWGTGDGALEKELATLSAKYCDSCEIKFIEGCSHWVQQEEPKLTNDYIREFIDK